MKLPPFVALAAACLALAGCRVDPNIVLLERELRLQEDEIYRLRARLQQYEETTQVYPDDENDDSQTSSSGPAASKTLLERASPQNIPDAAAAVSQSPQGSFSTSDPGVAPAWDDSSTPARQGDGNSAPSSELLDQDNPEPILPGLEEPNGEVEGQYGDPTAPTASDDSRHVFQLALDRRSTGGYNADGRPGDDGIRVVLYPRDAQGRPMAASAAVAVAVIDPTLDARVARWDFSPAQTATSLQRSGQGIELEMNWPAAPPVNRDLHLFVRYITSDGRKLEVDSPIRVTLPGSREAGWVRAAPPAQSGRSPQSLQASVPPQTHGPNPRPLRTAAKPPGQYPAAVKPKSPRPAWSPDRL